MNAKRNRGTFWLNGTEIVPGSRATLEIPLAGLYTASPVTMPVQVVHGRRDGCVVFVSAAVHGDEIKGVEIIRRLLRMPLLRRLSGTLIAVPIVNVFGFHNRSRYLPDRRDLNRSFPGSQKGSLAGRLADVFLNAIVAKSDFGVDLHTAAVHRDNLPQIRADLSDPIIAPLARTFGTPVVLHSAPPAGSLRSAANEVGVPVMVYEAGEALRFDEAGIRLGVRGVVQVLRRLAMLPPSKGSTKPGTVLRSSAWVRAEVSGIVRTLVKLGASVEKDRVLGVISDPFGDTETLVQAPFDGVVIGRTNLPLVYAGEALFHIGRTNRGEQVDEHWRAVQNGTDLQLPELTEEPPIV